MTHTTTRAFDDDDPRRGGALPGSQLDLAGVGGV